MAANNDFKAKHIMFSYQWDHQTIVSEIYDYLTQNQQWPIWMDTCGGMGECVSASMADGVQQCCALVCFLTPAYQNSINCKKELTYALQLRKPVIPCILGNGDGENWTPTDWLGLSIADLLFIDFQNATKDTKELHAKCDMLIQKIHATVGASPAVSDNEADEEEEA